MQDDRLDLLVPAVVRLPGGELVGGTCLELSESFVRLRTARRLRVGEPVELSLLLAPATRLVLNGALGSCEWHPGRPSGAGSSCEVLVELPRAAPRDLSRVTQTVRVATGTMTATRTQRGLGPARSDEGATVEATSSPTEWDEMLRDYLEDRDAPAQARSAGGTARRRVV